jgi:hypothetical protein
MNRAFINVCLTTHVYEVQPRKDYRGVRSDFRFLQPGHPGPHRHKARTARAPRCSTQRAGIVALPHAEGDGSSGVTSGQESNSFISVPAGVVGGVPVTRARNPWVPEAST